jgi:hypothetical protein
VADDWFRHTTWSEAIEASFLDRLSRSRSQRDQQLAIQIITLAEHLPSVALRLSELYFQTRKGSFDDARVWASLASASLSLEDVSAAMQAFRAALAAERQSHDIKTNTFAEYPYQVAVRGITSEYGQALQTLRDSSGHLAFPVLRFKWNAAFALITAAQGNLVTARAHATAALSSAEETESGFQYHQELGLVTKNFRGVVEKLRALA